MEMIVYIFAALFVWMLSIAIYQMTIACVCWYFKIGVFEVTIGLGPAIFKSVQNGWTLFISPIPLGGSTRLFSTDDNTEEEANLRKYWPQFGCFQDAPSVTKLLILSSGPISAVVLGLLCLAIPIWASSPALQKCSATESEIRPCGVQGLTFQKEPTTWVSQKNLFRDTIFDFMVRSLTGKSLEGWGGCFAFLLTVGAVGKLSFYGWLSCMGVLILWNGIFNLLPLPSLVGFMYFLELRRMVTGQKMANDMLIKLTLAGIIIFLGFFLYIEWLDIQWVWNLTKK